MTEWGTSVALSKNLMRDLRRRDDLERVHRTLRYALERKPCNDIRITEPELITIYDEYDENGFGIGEGEEVWVISAFGETTDEQA